MQLFTMFFCAWSFVRCRSLLAGMPWEGVHLQARSQDFCKGGHDDGGTEGPERGAEARSAGAPRGWGSPSPVWGSGGIAPRKFSKNQR